MGLPADLTTAGFIAAFASTFASTLAPVLAAGLTSFGSLGTLAVLASMGCVGCVASTAFTSVAFSIPFFLRVNFLSSLDSILLTGFLADATIVSSVVDFCAGKK